MKKLILVAGLFASVAALPVFAGTPCDDVKATIGKKLDGKGVKGYTLEAVAAADVKGQRVVGTCEAGAKKIVYSRGAAAKAETKAEGKHEGKKHAAKAETKHEAKAEAKTEAKAEAKHEAKAAEAAAPAAPSMKGPVMTKPGAAKQ